MLRCYLIAALLLVLPPSAIAQSDPASRLRAAAARGDATELERLFASGAALEAKDGEGQTALLLATAGGHLAAAKVLIDAGASINAQARNMDSPWLLAGARGHAEILQAMLPKEPDYTRLH